MGLTFSNKESPKAKGPAPKATAPKAQAVPKEATAPVNHKPALITQTPAEALASELLHLDAKLRQAGVAEINKRITDIKAELQAIGKNFPTHIGFSIAVAEGVVELSKCADQTSIEDVDGLIAYAEAKVGHEAIMATLKVNLTDLKKLLSENEIEKFSTHTTGSRTCKIKPNANS